MAAPSIRWLVMAISLGTHAIACDRGPGAGEAPPSATASATAAIAAASSSAAKAPAPSASSPAGAPSAEAAASPKEPTVDELWASKSPLAGPPLAGVAFGKPLWAHAVGTREQLEVGVPAGWKTRGGYEGMSTAASPSGKAIVSTMEILHAYGDPQKFPNGLRDELRRWYQQLTEVTLEPHVAVKAGGGEVDGVMQRGEGKQTVDKPGCLSPKAPPSCRAAVDILVFFAARAQSVMVVGLIEKDAAPEERRELLSALRSLKVVDATKAKVKGSFPQTQ